MSSSRAAAVWAASTSIVSGDEALLEAFQQNLTRQDLSGATCRHYLHDLKLFRDWLIWLHEGKKVSLTEVNPVDLAAFRKHLIQEKGHKPRLLLNNPYPLNILTLNSPDAATLPILGVLCRTLRYNYSWAEKGIALTEETLP